MQDQNSLTDKVASFALGAHVTAAAFLGGAPAFALADGEIVFLKSGETRVAAHPDATLLCATLAGGRLVTGGDDGRIVATSADGAMETLADEKGRWIDALAGRDDGAIAWAAGKQVRARDARGEVKSWTAPSSVRGLAFAAKGYRLAIAHYNGASLWFPNAAAAPEFLEWKGSHLDATLSADGRFLVTSMQENMLHGWRIADRKHMRMTGYPAKPRSLSWSHDGQWLATSGADACIVWPFQSKDGPMGKPPRECAVRPNVKISQVAFHPKALVLAVGYDDGWIMLVRLADASELLVRRTPEETRAPITALVWDAAGKRLAFGAADGAAGVLELPG